MKLKKLLCSAAMLLLGGFAFAQDDTLKATKADAPPVVDGDASDAAWGKAAALEIPSPKVTLKAVYTDKDIYVLAIWPDPTFSIVRGGSWSWDGKQWATTKSTGAKMSEDRIAFMWNMTVPDFGMGCMAKCHPGEKPALAYLEEGKADLWHMKAARSLPTTRVSQSGNVAFGEDGQPTAGAFTLIGFCDDTWVGELKDKEAKDGGRRPDAGKGASSDNCNKDKTAPLYVETDPADYIDAMTLRQSEIDSGEAVEVSSLTPEKINAIWAKYKALGARAPECILSAPDGSRADVAQAGVWKDGVWTVEFKRALDTGHAEDDVAFGNLKISYPFGIAIMDNCGGDDHKVSDVLSLVFEPAK